MTNQKVVCDLVVKLVIYDAGMEWPSSLIFVDRYIYNGVGTSIIGVGTSIIGVGIPEIDVGKPIIDVGIPINM